MKQIDMSAMVGSFETLTAATYKVQNYSNDQQQSSPVEMLGSVGCVVCFDESLYLWIP